MIGWRRYSTAWVAAAALLAVVIPVSATNTFTTAGNWHTAGNWSSNQVPLPGEDVVIVANVTLTNSSAALGIYILNAGKTNTFVGTNTALIASNVTIHGTMTHSINTDAAAPWAPDNRVWIQATNLTLATNGAINVNTMGYKQGYGPGVGTAGAGGWYGGGGHGGIGGVGNATAGSGGGRNGVYTAPSEPGSGGGPPGNVSTKGNGGGWVWLDVQNNLAVNGSITADGGVNWGAGSGYAAGAGGGIHITCRTYTGSNGVIKANGGNSVDIAGSGGGGRIAILCDPVAQTNQPVPPSGMIITVNPGSGTYTGAVGTCYVGDRAVLEKSFHSPGNWADSANWYPGAPVAGDRVYIDAMATLSNSTPALAVCSIMGPVTNTFLGTNAILIASNVMVYGGMTHSNNTATTTNSSGQWVPDNRIYVRCTNLTVAVGGSIDISRKGYRGGFGPGVGLFGGGGYYGGGGYGGRGGIGNGIANSGGPTYGSYSAPDQPGSGGGPLGGASTVGEGGGWARLEVLDQIAVNGSIRADGGPDNGGSGYSSGSGGAIHITCRTIAGSNGIIRANGGVNATISGAGGGGRIVILYDATAQSNLTVKPVGLAISANQGSGVNPGMPGSLYMSDATVFNATTLQGGQYIGLSSWVANSMSISNGIASFDDGFTLTVSNDLQITGNGGLWLTNAHMDVLGNFSVNQGFVWFYGTTNTACALGVAGDLQATNGARIYVQGGVTNGGPLEYGARVNVGGTLIVSSNAWIYPASAPFNGGSPLFHVGALTLLNTNGGFDADRRGYATNAGPGLSQGLGPGGWWGGSGHGGMGGLGNGGAGTRGGTYGSSNAPITAGTGCKPLDAFGGGVIWLNVDRTATLNGKLTANGFFHGSAGSGRGCSSGGSIFLTCRTLAGTTGILTARGGDTTDSAGAGGGGRIAIWRMKDACDTNAWTVSARGGTGIYPGDNGTIVWGWLRNPGTIFVIQ